MRLTDFYNQVSRSVDTKGTKINAAETRRVVAVAFGELAKLSASEAADVIAQGLAANSKKPARRKSTKRKTTKKKSLRLNMARK